MKMKFKIDESSRLTIVDDKKEVIIDTDKADLKELVKIIENHIKNNEEPKKVGTAYGYNPRTRRIEPLN